jgi:PAS domain S-box-containing protein
MPDRLNILILGDRNALSSQMAEAFMRGLVSSDRARIRSAGLGQGEVGHELFEVMAEVGVNLSGNRSKGLSELVGESFDLIITVTPSAQDACTSEARAVTQREDRDLWRARLPLFVGTPIRLHWSLPVLGEGRGALRSLRDEVRRLVNGLVTQGYLDAMGAERRRIKLLVDALDTGIVVHDESRYIYLFNRAAELVTGYNRSEVVGRDCHLVFGSKGICGAQCAFRDGEVMSFERRDYKIPFTTRDGVDRQLRMLVTPMEIHEGRPAEVVAQMADVTEIDGLRWQLQERHNLHGMVGNSPTMRAVFETIKQVAPSDYPVLVAGESGTGKELAALAIHQESRRAGGPFVPINCGALPEHILESELFGHVRGAFTGAIRDKKGRFELADGGTLFLDEVGELTPSFQVKLLRVIQEMRFERVGGESSIDVDVRVISATNRDLRQMAQRKEFREDLFYRLCVVPITMPPLRERRADIPMLVGQVLLRIQKETAKPHLTVSSSAMDLLLAYRWPGNVRELINALQFAAVRCPTDEIGAEHLPPEVRGSSGLSMRMSPSTAFDESQMGGSRGGRTKLSLENVEQALSQTGGNKVQAAKVLGVGRATLYRFLKDHPLD